MQSPDNRRRSPDGGRGSADRSGDRRGSSPSRRGGSGRRDGGAEEPRRTSTRREPAGIERAERRADAPPRAMASGGSKGPRPSAPEPPLAKDAPVDVPRHVRREIQRVTNDAATAERLLQHVTIAFAALDERDGRTALPHLQYLKARLPRTGMIREALGVALYLEEQFKDALSELQAFRRLTGSVDQNHLVADAVRAVGEGEHRIPELVQEMESAEEPPPDAARYEGRIVWASWLADSGDLGAGRAVLAPLLEEQPADGDVEEHHLRCWYVAGDLAQRAGDDTAARRWFERVSDVADGFFDTEQRLAALA